MLQKISTVCILLSVFINCAPARAESEASLQASSQASWGGTNSEASRGGHSEASWGGTNSEAAWGGWGSEASGEAGSEAGFGGMRNRYGGYGMRRGRYGGYRNYGYGQSQAQSNQQYSATMSRLKNDQAQQEKHERDLSSMPDSAFVKTYGGVSASTPGGVIDTHRRLNGSF